MKRKCTLLHGLMMAAVLHMGLSVAFPAMFSSPANVCRAETLTPANAPTVADDAILDEIIYIGQNENRAMDHMYYLSKNIGHRLAGSDSHGKATDWARDKFESIGLSNAHIEQAADISVGFDRGPASGSIVVPERRKLNFTTPAWSAGTGGPRRARAVAVSDDKDELEAMRSQLEGAWVLRPGFDDVDKYMEFMEKWNQLGVTIAGELLPSKSERLHAFGDMNIDWNDLPQTPKVILLEKEWNEIHEMLAGGEEVYLEFDIRNEFVEGPVPVYNVVADIPGSVRPDEYVIVGAHIDSWDAGEGVLDNGTGVAAVIEAARILVESGARPKRTIRFVLFAGEEVGMIGSKAYVNDHPELLPKISAVFNMDQGTDYINGIVATREIEKDFETVFEPLSVLDPAKSFEIKVGDHLPAAMDCVGKVDPKTREVTSGCGGGLVRIIKREKAGSETAGEGGEQIVNLTEGSACASKVFKGPAGLKDIPPGAVVIEDIKDLEDLLPGASVHEDLENLEDLPPGTEVKKMIAMGSSDHAPFLQAGVPAFSWEQAKDAPYGEFIHSVDDNLDKVVPESLEYSSAVIALGAYGVANLDHMLSRENLVAEEGEEASE